MSNTHINIEKITADISEKQIEQELLSKKKQGAINGRYKKQSDGSYKIYTEWPITTDREKK